MSDKWTRIVVVLSAFYVAAVVVAAILVSGYADRLWPATLLAFGPRWPLVVPGLILAPLAVRAKRRVWAGSVVAAVVLASGPYMGFALPLPRSQPSSSSGARRLRVVAFNAQDILIPDPSFEETLGRLDADIVAVTECNSDEKRGEIYGYQLASIHGLCFLSRLPIVAMHERNAEDAWERYGSAVILRVELDLDGRVVHVVGVHLATVRDGLVGLRHGSLSDLEKNTELRRWESEIARKWADEADGPLLVLGDLNLPVESRIYQRYWSDLTNAFDECGFGYGHTKHTRWFGVRIDHVLMSDAWRCVDVEVGDGGPSDHDPLIADLELLP